MADAQPKVRNLMSSILSSLTVMKISMRAADGVANPAIPVRTLDHPHVSGIHEVVHNRLGVAYLCLCHDNSPNSFRFISIHISSLRLIFPKIRIQRDFHRGERGCSRFMES